jgi:hypothetical protein
VNNVTGMIERKVTEAQAIPVKATYANHNDLSAPQKEALLSCGTNRQGATCARITPQEVLNELQAMGFLGEGWGLTKRGTIKRQILSEDQLNELFG